MLLRFVLFGNLLLCIFEWQSRFALINTGLKRAGRYPLQSGLRTSDSSIYARSIVQNIDKG